jgi:hypothetical protein
VKSCGFRIDLWKIEARLAEQPGVREAVVLARQDTTGEKRLVAYYTSDDRSSISVEQLREQLSARLPGYMMPAAFVRLESLPPLVSASGKTVPALASDLGRWCLRRRTGNLGPRLTQMGKGTVGNCAEAERTKRICRPAVEVASGTDLRLALPESATPLRL